MSNIVDLNSRLSVSTVRGKRSASPSVSWALTAELMFGSLTDGPNVFAARQLRERIQSDYPGGMTGPAGTLVLALRGLAHCLDRPARDEGDQALMCDLAALGVNISDQLYRVAGRDDGEVYHPRLKSVPKTGRDLGVKDD